MVLRIVHYPDSLHSQKWEDRIEIKRFFTKMIRGKPTFYYEPMQNNVIEELKTNVIDWEVIK